jgi:hypothetical protein
MIQALEYLAEVITDPVAGDAVYISSEKGTSPGTVVLVRTIDKLPNIFGFDLYRVRSVLQSWHADRLLILSYWPDMGSDLLITFPAVRVHRKFYDLQQQKITLTRRTVFRG